MGTDSILRSIFDLYEHDKRVLQFTFGKNLIILLNNVKLQLN